ncbi:MAG TPA: hypothetical protein VLX92_28715 [Kofleriaceae bacterium]|nr:hypothetical protein [Kofleriaceae bacterium]
MNDRRRARRSILPLAVIAIGYIVPPLLSTGLAPSSAFGDGDQLFLGVYAGALVLAVLTDVAARRDAVPGAVSVVIALLAIGAASVPTVPVVCLLIEDRAPVRALGFGAAILAAAAVAALALRRRGWWRWSMLLGAFALAALPFACPVAAGLYNLFPGGAIFLIADLTLIAQLAIGARCARG